MVPYRWYLIIGLCCGWAAALFSIALGTLFILRMYAPSQLSEEEFVNTPLHICSIKAPN